MLVTTIGPDLAVPFVADYARRHNLPLDSEGSERVWWWGAWDANCLRGVTGFTSLPEIGNSFLVYGLYGDGTDSGDVAEEELGKLIYDLIGGESV